MTNTATTALPTGWTARVTAPGLAREESFAVADYPNTSDEGDTAWVAARDALVDDLLSDLSENADYAAFAKAIGELLCDANPDEPVRLTLGNLTITLLPIVDGHSVETFGPDSVVLSPAGHPVASFHVGDEWDEETESFVGQDENEAHAAALICAAALDAAAGIGTASLPAFTKVELHQYDSDTWQVMTTDQQGVSSEFAVVGVIQPDSEGLSHDEAEQAYALAVEQARTRGEALVAALAKMTR